MATPPRFALIGHGGFYNRGCEAIVRSTVQMLQQQFRGCEILLASNEAEDDRRHPAADGVTVLDNRMSRWSGEWVGQKVRKVLSLPLPPAAVVSRAVGEAIRGADAVLQIGGDNFTSDYGMDLGSGLLAANEIALGQGIPLVIWGASIGPFDSADLEEAVLGQLRRAALITVREAVTRDYLQEHGIVDNVLHVADPAMLLEPDPVELSGFWPGTERVAGINISELSARYRKGADAAFGQRLLEAVVDEVMAWDGWGVLLVPHVIKPGESDDYRYMAAIPQLARHPDRVRLVPPGFDARQTKYIISNCDLLAAARTHATIAAYSSGVPTLAFAYSRKAYGIGLDLFGHSDWIVDIREISSAGEVITRLRRLVAEVDSVASHLGHDVATMKDSAMRGVTALREVMEAQHHD
ncbi:MAG: polysaccharide pyruvyl transferase family protein [candidate division WS1 bacterium]|jgi:colanic acid/amylovoran biosynthesis protein|nr:polysaccharide pyruvyl transferase family protein [candidate division WS1 bacterium]